SQSRINRSSTGLSSRASDANRSVTAAALSPRDTKTGVSCLARISLVPAVMGPCAVRDFTMEWHYMERFGKPSFNGSRNIGQRLVQNDAFERGAYGPTRASRSKLVTPRWMLPTAWFSAQRHVARSALLSPHGNPMLRRASTEPRRIHLRKYRLAIEAIAQRYMRFTASSRPGVR